jgi:hypothetical protein
VSAATRIFRTPIDRPVPIGRTGYNPEFGCQYDSLTSTPESLADFDLRSAIDIRCVEEVDAQIQRAMDKRNGIALTLRTAGVHFGDPDPRASKSEGGRFDTTLAVFAILHGVVMWMERSPVWFREVGLCRCYRRELVHEYGVRAIADSYPVPD